MLGRFEEAVLIVMSRGGVEVTTNEIHAALSDALGREASFGAIFTTLDRLTEKKFVTRRKGDPLPQRGGKARNFYTITGGGRAALAEAQRSANALVKGLNWAGQGA